MSRVASGRKIEREIGGMVTRLFKGYGEGGISPLGGGFIRGSHWGRATAARQEEDYLLLTGIWAPGGHHLHTEFR